MSDVADRYRKVAQRFTDCAAAVPAAAWENPAPCEGWVARDVVGHLVEWMSEFLASGGGPALSPGPSVDDDPVGAWTTMSDGLQALLDDPATASSEIHHPYVGTHTVANAIGIFMVPDIVIHTWDLARATGLDETLDPDEVSTILRAMEPIDDMLRGSGQFGARVDVPADADEQTRLIAFTGRRP